jgi:disulfide bond formation protein DsbB
MAAMPIHRLDLSYRTCGLIAALAAAVALGIAQGSERWGGLVPCALCLVERWPYRIALVLGLVAAVSPPKVARGVLALLALTVFAGVVVAATHVGVEFHWWKSPLPECAAPTFSGGSIAERLAHMPAVPAKPCDDPTYFVPGLPLSIAETNLLFATVFTLATIWASLRRPQR